MTFEMKLCMLGQRRAENCLMELSWEKDCLSVNPFEGDFGDGEVRLTDKLVTARKDHHCHGESGPCDRGVQKGDRSRVIVERHYGELRSYRWCEPCSKELAAALHGKAAWQNL